MLDDRKTTILKKVVAEHIETGQPVGSSHVVRDGTIDVSPATVRADMATLEREGYLTHPHTSAGRVPTDLGYRFFVDHLDETSALGRDGERRVDQFFAAAHGELERMLRDTSQLLASLTDYAAVVVAPTHETATVCSVLVTRLAEQAGLLLVVLSNGAIDKYGIELAPSVTDAVLESANVALREQLVGSTVGQTPLRLPQDDPELAALLGICSQAMTGSSTIARPEPNDVYVGGTARMAEQFEAVNTVREVLSILEQSLVVVSLLSDALTREHSVAIGGETGVASLAECSLVVAPYTVGSEIVGAIGVLGPTRMNYAHALAAVAVVSERLGRQLSAG
jgi:heat-inducible transcriptional repressor